MFEAFTFDNIMERLLDSVRSDVDKREGSIIYDALAPAALELETAYIMLDYTLNQGFADTAEREYLIRRAQERGITPYPATAAVLKGVFTPAEIDVTGKRFSLGELNYAAGDAIEGEAGAYELTCETAGAAGGRTLGALIPIEYIDGLETARAVSVLIPGEDEEETEALRARYMDSLSAKGYGGNVRDYLDWCMAVDGVGGARITPVWNGGGTVKCELLDGDFSPAGSALIARAQTAIDPDQDAKGAGLAPIGHVVTVAAPETVTVNAQLTVEFAAGYGWNNMESAISGAVAAYLKELRQAWSGGSGGTVVRVSQIETRLLALDGVIDCGGTKLNGAEGNLTVSGNAVPVMGAISHA